VLPPDAGVTVAPAYDVDEGGALDLVVDPNNASAMVATSALPANSSYQNGVFSFNPDFTQAGVYSVTFTATAGSSSSPLTIAIRVHNVVHITGPSPSAIGEGSAAPVATFSSDDPAGTVVTYTADLSAAPGASFDPIARTLSFTPGIRFLDSHPATVVVPVTAQGQELDGKTHAQTVNVEYQVTEVTSFSSEIRPLFLFPLGATGGANPELESVEGHNCLQCHDGSATTAAGLDLTAASAYGQLVGHTPASDGINGATCGSVGGGIQRVVASDPTKSLLYMKVSGTNGNGAAGPPCGVQEPNSEPQFGWTVSDQDAWNACPNTTCQTLLLCADTDIACKTNARYVRKLRVWIAAGAPNN